MNNSRMLFFKGQTEKMWVARREAGMEPRELRVGLSRSLVSSAEAMGHAGCTVTDQPPLEEGLAGLE